MPEREEIISSLADWIDARAIAESIVEHLEEEEIAITDETAQSLWLDFLEMELADGLRRSTHILKEKQ